MRKFYPVKGLTNSDVFLPKRETLNSAGYDLASIEDISIMPNEIKLISTGLKAQMDSDDVLLIFARSSLPIKKGLVLANSVGVIDADYFENQNNDGLIKIMVRNITDHEVKISKGERIAQGVFVKYEKTDDDDTTEIRIGGFGSTK